MTNESRKTFEIRNDRELEFAVFCIENVAASLGNRLMMYIVRCLVIMEFYINISFLVTMFFIRRAKNT